MTLATRTRKARRNGRCPLCRTGIERGQSIALLGKTWTHTTCAATRLTARAGNTLELHMGKTKKRKPRTTAEPSIVGWRCWFISPFGGLMSPALAIQTGWTSAEITATCPNGEELTGPHTPPGKDCTCGLRIFEMFDDLMDVIRRYPEKSNCSPKFWRAMSQQNNLPELYRYRQRYDALSIPDVIGTVYGYGHTEPGKKLGDLPDLAPEQYVDPPGILRVERVKVGNRLYLAPHMMQNADLQAIGYKPRSMVASLKRLYPKSKVHIGVNYGPEWLDEITESVEGRDSSISPEGTEQR